MTGHRPIPRLGVLWCPNWAVVAAQAEADEPVVVLHGNRVVAHSLAAGREGIAVGQRRRQAQTCCPSVRIVAHDPDGDARRFEGVVTAIAALIPRIEVTEPGMLSFLAKGPSRYFGGEAAMADRMTALAGGTVSEAASSFVTDDSQGAGAGGTSPEPAQRWQRWADSAWAWPTAGSLPQSQRARLPHAARP